ncbi:MAG: FAD-dependent oxidoreductase [Bacteroidota bacterium]|nr:FAD-dependent oxidoreductase [Bacteroidota bacterium]
MIDTLIVGFGIAGLNYAEKLRQNKKEFRVIAPVNQSASKLSAGIINPTVLKRFNSVWKSDEFLNYALPHYYELQDLLQKRIIEAIPIYRILDSNREQNEWVVACSKLTLQKYFNNKLISGEKYRGIKAPFKFGEVKNTAKVDSKTLINSYIKKIIPNQYFDCKLDYDKVEFNPDGISYQGIKAKKIVFCEGFQNIFNPFFNYLPLIGSKGEMLVIKCDQLKEKVIFKGPIFLSPIGKKKFWVGATFNRFDKTTKISEDGNLWLRSKLEKFFDLPYQILDHKAQIRATVIDRRPILGIHPKNNRLFILNGLGTRGVLMAPLLSHWLYEFIEKQYEFPIEVSIKRFEKKHYNY